MKNYKAVFFVILSLLFSNLSAQIIVNGRSPVRYYSSGPQNSLSISYGNIFWVDGENVPLQGSSYSMQQFHNPSVENMNRSLGLSVGYERVLARKIALRAAFSTAKLITGLQSREDLITTDRSRIAQLGAYFRYSLTKNPDNRFQIQWLAGPELIYVKKDVLIDGYVEGEGKPDNLRQNVSILEGAAVTGLGLSFRISNAFSLFSDGMVGVSLPGKGLKMTNSGIGLKYNW